MVDIINNPYDWEPGLSFVDERDEEEELFSYKKPRKSFNMGFECITGEKIFIAVGIALAKIALWYFYQAAEYEGMDVSAL
ncbi:hypothetical protein ASZ90_018547 [hydrocarbon metagenome]|uniref:Uncharacterized protein n=1 Tax=hydrocarbon metagenome TaxID=938273 RepID=A0A0W8E5Z4_9ZZZZ